MAHVQSEDMAARLARSPDHVFLHFQDSLRVFALLAQDELLDEAVEYVLHLASVVTAVDDVPLSLDVQLGLSTQLEPKVLGHISWWPRQCPGDVDHVDHHGLDAVPLALHLGLQPRHLVPVEGVLDVSVDIESHPGSLFSLAV